jgi:hypothetical protein
MLSIQWPIQAASLGAMLGQGREDPAVPAEPFDWSGCEPDEGDDWKPPDSGEHDDDLPLGEGPDAAPLWPPDGMLGQLASGPLLAMLVGDADLSSRAACPDELVVEVAAAAARLQAWAASIELAATAKLTDRVLDWRGVAKDADDRHVSAEQMSACELAAALNVSATSAMNRVGLAEDLRRLPATRAALAVGAIDLPKARMTVEVLRPLTDEQVAAVEATVIGPEPDRVRAGKGRVHSQLQQALRRAAIRANPAAFEKQGRDAFESRRMEHYSLGDTNPGMAGIAFTHTADVIAQASDYVRALAKAAIAADAPGEQRTMDQACADVFADLCTGRTVHAGPASTAGPSVHVVVGVGTLLDQDDEPAWLAGYGPISAATARRIAADPTGTWRKLFTDPRTGRMDELSVKTYDVPADMDRHVRGRDLTCRWPGCTRPARRCDTDHRIPWPAGATEACNLQCLCRGHHRIKTHTRTTTRLDEDTGDTIVTLPSGHTYRRPPDPPLGEPDPPPQVQPDPADDIPPF